MSEPVTPKVKKHIIEGEYADASQTDAKKASVGSEGSSNEQGAAKRVWWRPKSFTQWLQLLLAIFMSLILFYFVQQSRTQTQQVEAINRLQLKTYELSQSLSEMSQQQKKALKPLTDELNDLQQRVAQLEAELHSPEHRPVISQADVDALKQQVQTLQEKLAALSEKSLQAIQEQAKEGGAVIQSPEFQQQLNTLQQQMQQKLQGLGKQLKGLLEQPAEKKKQAQNPVSLTPMEIQQWAVKINTQWQLTGNINQTLAQLRALEQAIAVSDLPNKANLLKAIGQDEEMLKQQSVSHETLPNTQALRAWLKQVIIESNPTQSTESSQERTNASAEQRLMQRFTQVFSVHKQKDGAELTAAEKAALQDILLQRALFLADQLDWAVETHNPQILQKTLQQLREFIQKYYPQQQAALAQQLKPFAPLKFPSRPNLYILEAL